jgi:phage FluMu protein gp41
VYVPAGVEAAASERVEVTQRNEALLAEISQINLELLRRRALE